MRKTTIRRLLKATFLPAALLLGLVIWDYAANDSQWMWPILSLTALLFLASIVLLLMEPRARFLRLPTQPDEEQKTIIYRRT